MKGLFPRAFPCRAERNGRRCELRGDHTGEHAYRDEEQDKVIAWTDDSIKGGWRDATTNRSVIPH